MAFFIVHDSVLGVAAARPILRWGECDDAMVAAQALDVNDVAVLIPDLVPFDGMSDDEFETEAAHYYTWNTATLAVSAVARTDNLDIVEERVLAQVRGVLADTSWTQTIEGLFSDGKFQDWLTYRAAVRDVVLQAGYPATVTWPTPPDAITGTSFLQLPEADGEPLWTRIYRKGNAVGTVSRTFLGTPTGALMEAGSNANGRYRRFACGFQICWHRLGTNTTGTTNWTFPAPFGGDNISMSVTPRIATGVEVMIPSVQTPGASAFNFGVLNASGTRLARTCELMAVGNW